MIRSPRFGRRFGGRTPTRPAPVGEAPAPEMAISGYTDECLIAGYLRFDADRLTDLLNGHAELRLRDVLVEVLADGQLLELPDYVVRRDELVAVQGVGPRGSAAQRLRTSVHPVRMTSGPFLVWGHLHAPPGADPLASVRHRFPMVPLTEARIEYDRAGERREERVATLIVNRDLVESIQAVPESAILAPEASLDPYRGLLARGLGRS